MASEEVNQLLSLTLIIILLSFSLIMARQFRFLYYLVNILIYPRQPVRDIVSNEFDIKLARSLLL